MLTLPQAARPLVGSFRRALTRPGFDRFVVPLVGTIVTFGRRTVSRILWTLGPAAPGHPGSYHRLLARGRWSPWPLGKVLAAMVLELVPDGGPACCPIDDTVTRHKGARVYGTGCHRDAVRSGGDHAATTWGHKWVVLAVLVPLPFTRRRWALPVLCALYRPPAVDLSEGRRHKTPCDLARGLVAAMVHWFPGRRFILLGDAGFASHELARFCHRHRRRLTLVARAPDPRLTLHALFDHRQAGTPCRQTQWRRRRRGVRPRCRKGRGLPAPADTVAQARSGGHLPLVPLQWYGQSRRVMELFSAAGGWYRGRGDGTAALVPLRWVYTCDPRTGKEDWFLCTDPAIPPAQVVGHFAGRWSIEVTFEEARAHLGLETPRQRCAGSVLRTTPCLLGLFSLVALIFARLWRQDRGARRTHQTPCYHKAEPTFADALYAVRRTLWDGCILKHVLGPRRVTTLPPRLKRLLLTRLAEAA